MIYLRSEAHDVRACRAAGGRVARYYCAEGHTTFSLLPNCLASRLSLAEVEQVVVGVEETPTLEQAAAELRPDIET